MIDWLIVGCLMSRGKYFMHIAYKNTFTNILKLCRNEVWIGQLGEWLLTAAGKIWRVGYVWKILNSVAATMYLLFLEKSTIGFF